MSRAFDFEYPDKSKPMHEIKGVISKKRSDVIRWNGWGYNDSRFVLNNKGIIQFTGKRYPIGDTELPDFTSWVQETLGVDISKRNASRETLDVNSLPPSTISNVFLSELEALKLDYSVDATDRLIRSHGQTLEDIYRLRLGSISSHRIPDVVVWPGSHEDVVNLVQIADKHNVVIVPFGGGTSVSGAATCPNNESRPILALDTSQMNNVMWLDESNLLICCQSGITGQDLEKFLISRGYTTGHEPDSYEFSTLGGWVATRASGMKKNVYGNIEDLCVAVSLVSPRGVLRKTGLNPRHSVGPDLNHLILGSEGTLGVVTEAVIKIRPLPEVKKYGSIIFPDFEAGVKCMREVAKQRCQPASIRLMDNEQFQFGLALKGPSGNGLKQHILTWAKRVYLTKLKGFNLKEICVATLLFEGTAKKVQEEEEKLYLIASKCNGIPAGEKYGEQGYMLTFVIAYIRDIGLDFNVVAESFETSVPWDKTLQLCRNVKYVVRMKCREAGIQHFLISHRVTQTYDSGCCVYFYFGFNWTGIEDPVATYEEIESAARDEILANGGSLSHHHGVGKLRAKWYESQVSSTGADLYTAAKKALDPKNIFATGNILENYEANLKPKL